MLTVGLTGNYGMGKSSVLEKFKALGAVTIDADGIVDGLLKKEPVLERIRGALGDEVFLEDGCLDRAKVADLIFKDERKRDILEGILHPLVYDEIEELLEGEEKAGGGDRVVVVEIPLMFEKGQVERFQRIITVHAEESVVFQRLGEKGIGREKAEERLRTQMDIDEKMRRSDFVVDNSGPMEEMAAQVREIYSKLLKEEKSFKGE